MPNGEKSVLVAVGLDPLIQDFAAVASFALNVTCTPNFELARRLTQSEHASLGVSNVPSKYVSRVFDKRVDFSQDDGTRLENSLFHYCLPPKHHRPNWERFFEKYSEDFDIPSTVENLPGQQRLLEFERIEVDASLPEINWRELLLSPQSANPSENVESDQETNQ